MSVIALLAEQTALAPILDELTWDIDGRRTAVADLDRLIEMGVQVDPETGKRILKVIAPPPILPLVNQLHEIGWARGSETTACDGWHLTATLERGDATLQVRGTKWELPDGTHWDRAPAHATMAYFSPPPPPLGRSKAAKALAKEWNDRLMSGDWGGWTATPLPC